MTKLAQREHGRFLDAKEPDLEIFEIPAGSAKRSCRCSGVCRICLCVEKEPRNSES
jgi:hypothetical protein